MNELLEKALFWEKYRPSKIEDMILPDSITRLAKGGINGNYLFHSASGMGKTTLVRILLQEYPDGQHIMLGGKLGVDELRNKVKSFCTEMIAFADPNKLRVVYFEEFDRATRQLQEELKSFMEDEKYSHRIRFIATCNNVSRIDSAIRSRFTEVDFTTTGDETVKLKNQYVRRLLDISENEKLNLDKKDLISIVQNRFPDFRNIWNDVQFLYKTGTNISTQTITEEDEKLFNIIIKPTNSVETWEYLYVNWMDKIDSAFTKLGKDYFKFIQTKHSDKINSLGSSIILVSEYSDSKLPTCIDPFVTLCALVYKLQELHK